jgi:hypothetical protein
MEDTAMREKLAALTLVCIAVVAAPFGAKAQSCTSVFADMVGKWQTGRQKTALTLVTHQANGLSAFSGARPMNPGSPQYEARLVYDGGYWMTTVASGGVKGQMQFSDRVVRVSGSGDQPYSAQLADMEPIDIYLSASYIYVYDNKWGNWSLISGLQCQNGLIWGLGTPIANNNAGKRALWIFSYSFSSQ